MSIPEQAAFIAAIEERYRSLRGMPLMLSSEDIQRVLRWHEEGIPLFVVLEAIDAVFRRAAERKPRRTPRSLAYCEPAVREAFDAWNEGQLGARRDEGGRKRGNEAALEEAAQRVAESKAPEAARTTAVDALRALAASGERGPSCAGHVSRIGDALLVACIAALEDAERAVLERDAREELAPYAAEMTRAHHERALAAALERQVRRRFALPDLALIQLR